MLAEYLPMVLRDAVWGEMRSFSKAVQSTNGSHAAHNNASLINTISSISNKCCQTLGERPAHAIHIVIAIDPGLVAWALGLPGHVHRVVDAPHPGQLPTVRGWVGQTRASMLLLHAAAAASPPPSGSPSILILY